MTCALVLHGGAGARPGRNYAAQRADMERLARQGQAWLAAGRSALDVVTETVAALEASGLYVAGRGSGPTTEGAFELDASVMDGATGRAGAVAAMTGIVHPVRAARTVLEDGRHVLLAGDGARAMAVAAGLATVDDPDAYYTEHAAHGSGEAAGHGTVGAVARDRHGALAAATSTGGTFGKRPGRVGDTPLIGAGTWADARVAVSCTGLGEAFIRTMAAHDVAARMRHGRQPLDAAARDVLADVARQGGDGGLIAVDAEGRIAMPWNSDGMKRAAVIGDGPVTVRIFEPEPD